MEPSPHVASDGVPAPSGDTATPRPPSGPPRRRVALWIAVVLAVIVAGIAVASRRPEGGAGPSDPVAVDVGDGAPLGVSGDGPRVRGRVLVELPAPEPAAVVVVDGDTARAVDGEGDDSTTGPDPAQTPGIAEAASDPVPPAAVETTAPPAGSCRIRAWQDGVEVAPMVTCDAEGDFEIVLAGGTEGRVAFDLEVPGRLRAVVESEAPQIGTGRLPDVALGVGERVAGVITDSRGVALVGLEISARPDPDLGEPEPWRTSSTAEGRFVFDTLPPGPALLRVHAEGFAPTVLEVIAPEDDVQLVVDRLYTLKGEVMGPPEVLARTRARVAGSGVWPARDVKLDGGAFAFAAIPEGVYALVAVAAALEPGQSEFASIPLEDVAPDGHVTLALVPAHRVAVRVVDAAGTPVADARVTLGAAHLGLLQHHGRTDVAGEVALGPVTNGEYVVRADADGFLAAPGVAVTVVDAAPEVVELRLSRPGRIRGVVVDEDDVRVAEAWIEVVTDVAFSVGEAGARRTVFDRARRAEAAFGSLGVTTGAVPAVPAMIPVQADGTVTSDADGGFELGGLVPGTYTLRAVHGRFAASDPVEIRVRAGADIEGVRLVVRSGWRLTGRVLGGNDRPIAGAWVELDDGTTYGTDERGVFDAGLRRGRQLVVARAPGMVPARREVVVRAAVDIELQLGVAEAELRGRVVDDNLRPLGDVQVTLRPDSALVPTEVRWTDARGEFAFAALPEAPVVLLFDRADHAPATVAAQALPRGRGRPIEVVLVRGWTLVVDVRDAATGVALPSATVEVGGHRGLTDRTGIAEFATLADDEVDVTVHADGHGTRSVTARRGGGDRSTVVVTLDEGGGVEGVVTDWAGDPVAGADVVIRGHADVLAELRTDARGRFAARGLPAGDLVIEAYPPADREDDLAPVALRSDVLRGRTTRGVDLRFDRR